MPSFPALHTGVVGKYPITRGHKYRTQILVAEDLTEQRFSMGQHLASFELTFTNVSTHDKELVRSFFDGRRGTFDHGWDLTLTDTNGVPTTYGNLEFIPGQSFDATNTHFDRWDFSLRVRQTRS